MKLYTEEQLTAAYFMGNMDGFLNNKDYSISERFEPIELPSDEDTSHLQWMYDRMSNIHGENENYDYMLKFKEIIEQLKKGGNNMKNNEEILKQLMIKAFKKGFLIGFIAASIISSMIALLIITITQ